MIVFCGAKVEAHFGVLDENGNVRPGGVATVEVHELSAQAFTDLFAELLKQRDALTAQEIEAAKPREKESK